MPARLVVPTPSAAHPGRRDTPLAGAPRSGPRRHCRPDERVARTATHLPVRVVETHRRCRLLLRSLARSWTVNLLPISATSRGNPTSRVH